MSKCKYFKKSENGKCEHYKGNKKESCSYNCSKIKAKGTVAKEILEVIVE